MEYIFGKNTVLAFIESKKVNEVYLVNNFKDEKILSILKNSKVKITYKDAKYLDSINNNNQGIVGLINHFDTIELETLISKNENIKNPTILMLDGIEDPHNFGAIIRSVEAFSINGVIIPKHSSCKLNSTVAKVSTGALANVDVCEVVNLTQAINILKKAGYWIVEAEAFNSKDYRDIDYNMKSVLVVGSEGFGISSLVKKQADFNVFIPMSGKVNSLNVSVATAILLEHIANTKK